MMPLRERSEERGVFVEFGRCALPRCMLVTVQVVWIRVRGRTFWISICGGVFGDVVMCAGRTRTSLGMVGEFAIACKSSKMSLTKSVWVAAIWGVTYNASFICYVVLCTLCAIKAI